MNESPVSSRSLLQWYRPNPLGSATPFVAELACPRHFHPEFELNVVTRGRARFGVGGGFFEISVEKAEKKGGFLLAMRPMVEHELLEASADLEMWVVSLPVNGGEDVASCPLGRYAASTPRFVPEQRLLPLVEAYRRIHSFWSPAAADELMSSARFAMHDSSPASSQGPHPAAARTVRLLEQDPTLDRSKLALRLQLSAAELSRIFHREVGTSLAHHRNRLRMRHLLHHFNSASSLLRAAIEAGFGSEASLFRVFREETGCAPLEFLRGGAEVLASRTKPLTLRAT